ILIVILSADGGSAFEHHVLEEVSGAGNAGALVGAAHVCHPAAGDGGFVVALDHEDAHAVGESFFDDRNLLGFDWKNQREQKGKRECESAKLSLHPDLE